MGGVEESGGGRKLYSNNNNKNDKKIYKSNVFESIVVIFPPRCSMMFKLFQLGQVFQDGPSVFLI